MPQRSTFLGLTVSLLLMTVASSAAEPVTLENVINPGPNRSDEPLAGEFSLTKAMHFLDSAALTWQKDRQCFTCHTNFAYLYARPLLARMEVADATLARDSGPVQPHDEVRKFAEQLVQQRWPDKGPRWDAEVVATAAALAFNDAATGRELHEATRTALDRMWTVQRDDGGWSWLNCDWPPMESDDHYGACLAAIAVAYAGADYRASEAAAEGIAKLQKYLAENTAPTVHHEALLLWAASRWPELIRGEQRAAAVTKLRALQNQDGGWSLASLGNWQREDGSPQDRISDGYGTGFVVYVLREAAVPAKDPQLERGIVWLKQNQRASGRWFTRSLKKDSQHYITHCGTAYALMALAACAE